MKKIIGILYVALFVSLLVGVVFLNGCGKNIVTPPIVDDVVDTQLGVDDIDNELNSLDVNEEDFDLTDLDSMSEDLGDL